MKITDRFQVIQKLLFHFCSLEIFDLNQSQKKIKKCKESYKAYICFIVIS